MFKKVLIANRGEIAIRIIRTCKEMGIKTVAIYSEVDRCALHVLKADEAYFVGEAASKESYLNIKSILKIIKKCKADAVHPGYGFLSENSDFANIIINNNIGWIGPSPESISMMGDKIAARKLANKIGVPIIPGTIEPIKNNRSAIKIAKKIGYPILIKACAGGGGKGMRVVYSDLEMKELLILAQSESKKSFSDDRIFLEKYLEEPHHIEIQVLSDNKGNIVSFGERECSIQRRYQKIIEEAPSPFIDSDLKKKLSTDAIKITSSCNYEGLGTIEFLVDKYKNYYFLEMNTRIQVEHPITEMTTNIDLVNEQIKIAYGKKIKYKNKDILFHGHAIECRIYAEDGFNNFMPSTGVIEEIRFPQGPGVRIDEGIQRGQEVSSYYDPLLAKLITWGIDRKQALNRMIRALEEFYIYGIKTNIQFCNLICRQKSFFNGKYSTKTLEVLLKNVIDKNNILNHKEVLAATISAINLELDSDNKLDENNCKIEPINDWSKIGRLKNLK